MQDAIDLAVAQAPGAAALPPEIAQKVALFMADRVTYRSAAFKEMSLRSEFLNPLLEALGWDPSNTRGSAYSDREVVQEASVLIEGQQKAPDYAFLINGQRRFFVEAKRPSVNIQEGKAAAYQIRRYCWSAGLPFGLVTDFEEFGIYDCRAVPDPTDSAAVGRMAYFTCEELEENWSLLVNMFSRDAVADGALERLAASSKPPAGTRPIDVAFLDEIRSWRHDLAVDIADRNPSLSAGDLNHEVQLLIDRLVFLRTAEARGLEAEGALQAAITGQPGVYGRLITLFQRADDRYNSGLFHQGQESAPTAPATAASVGLVVADEVVTHIVSRLYYPEPYEFSVLPADILGRIYEQFLGERITLGSGREVSIDLKPDLRRAGGVYYTPSPIVQYIVEETMGPLLRGKTPSEVAKLAFLDPACGSGSFLIEVFQHLLDWHRDYYADRPKLAKRYLEVGPDGQSRLTTAERKRILLANVHGVDIDPQAVEVTKLSLLLKVIEGQSQMELQVGRLLPDLDRNIRCGNSLVGTDFSMPLQATSEEVLAYNPFDWAAAFPTIIQEGGFDAVLGNPPYLNVDAVWGQKDPRLAYLKSAYPSVYTDKTDILFYFLKKATDLCRGETAFIVSRSFLEADKARKLRGVLASTVHVRSVLDFRQAQVFPKVGINTAIVRLTRSKAVKLATFARYAEKSLPAAYTSATLKDAKNLVTVSVPMKELSAGPWNFGSSDVRDVLAKIDAAGTAVGDILHVGQGMQTGANKAFTIDLVPARRDELDGVVLLYERVRNSDIKPYEIGHSDRYLLYPEEASSFEQLPHDVRHHLELHRDDLESRAAYRRGNCDWWRFTWPLHKQYFGRSRIFCPYRAPSNRFALDEDRRYLGITDTTVLYDGNQPEDLRYILGVLNSRVLTARFRYIGKLLGGGVLEYYENTVKRLPIPRRAPGDPQHDAMVAFVRRREEAAVELRSTLVNDEQQILIAECHKLNEQIEALVVELFGLSADDVALLDAQLT